MSDAFMIFRRITFTSLFILITSLPVNADSIICNNKVISTGASKAEVLSKCGQPIYSSTDKIKTEGKSTWITEDRMRYEQESVSEETWTYIIDGCYRELVFVGGKLEKIIHGGTAR
jgi:hypothetical protein